MTGGVLVNLYMVPKLQMGYAILSNCKDSKVHDGLDEAMMSFVLPNRKNKHFNIKFKKKFPGKGDF